MGQTLRHWLAACSLALLCLAMALAPMPFGSVGLPIVTWWVVVLGISAVLASFQRLGVEQARLLLVLWAFCGCWTIVLVLQNMPWSALAAIDNPLWGETSRLLGVPLQAIPAALKSQALLSQGPPLLAVLALSCALVLGANETYAKTIMMVFAWSGLAYAVFGIASYVIDPSKILGFDKDAYLAELTATFYNRNTAAIYFGSCAIVWLARLLEHFQAKWMLARVKTTRRNENSELRSDPIGTEIVPELRKRDSSRQRVRRRSRRWQRGVSIDWVLPALALTICMVAMFMTRSRAGSLASVIGLIIVLVAFFRRALASRTALLVAGAGTIAGSALLIQILGGGVAERISVDGVSDAGRWHTYHSTLELIRSAPWLGTGLGTYPWVFPPFRSPDITTWGVWDRAHNTYLELMAETGIPLAALLAIGWFAMLAVLVRGVLTRRRGIGRPAAALGVLVAATLHTMVDFPLQIPAYSIIVFALTGVGLAQSWRAPDPSAQTKDTQLSLV